MKLSQLLIVGAPSLVVGIMIGLSIAVAFAFWQTGGVNVPYDLNHNTIAESVVVTVSGRECELKHVFTSVARFLPQDIINIAAFLKGGDFTQSLWVFTIENNVQVAMTIWGGAERPDNETAYLIEFGRLTFEQVSIQGVTFNIDWIANSQEGYCLVDLTYP